MWLSGAQFGAHQTHCKQPKAFWLKWHRHWYGQQITKASTLPDIACRASVSVVVDVTIKQGHLTSLKTKHPAQTNIGK